MIITSNYPDVHLLEIVLTNELVHDLRLRLDLQHLQNQTNERRRFDVASVSASHVSQVDRLIDQQLHVQSETVLFPVLRIVDAGSDDLFDCDRASVRLDMRFNTRFVDLKKFENLELIKSKRKFPTQILWISMAVYGFGLFGRSVGHCELAIRWSGLPEIADQNRDLILDLKLIKLLEFK